MGGWGGVATRSLRPARGVRRPAGGGWYAEYAEPQMSADTDYSCRVRLAANAVDEI